MTTLKQKLCSTFIHTQTQTHKHITFISIKLATQKEVKKKEKKYKDGREN